MARRLGRSWNEGSAEIVPSSFYPRQHLIHKVLDRFAQAVVRGATDVLNRGVQAVAHGAARCSLHVHGRGAKTDAFDRSFAVLSTQEPYNLRHA